MWARLLLLLCHWRDRLCADRTPLTFGAWGERWATRFLRAQGCRILGQNVRPCHYGELDIIARQRGVLLFVEVKSRRNEDFGRPLTAVTSQKRKMLRRAANHWLAQNQLLDADTRYRFDVVEVVGQPGALPEIRWVQRIDMSVAPPPDLY